MDPISLWPNSSTPSGDVTEYAVEKVTLGTLLLKVIRENEVLEEDSAARRSGQRCWIF